MLNTLALGATLIASANAAHLTPEAAKIWTEVGRANPMELKGFTVGMPMKDFPLLERTLDEVSNPKSKRYGQWLSKEEADAIAATPENIAAEVKKWATSTGAHCERKPFCHAHQRDRLGHSLELWLRRYGMLLDELWRRG